MPLIIHVNLYIQYMYSLVRWRVMCAPLTTTHFPTKPFISVSFFLLEYYNFRRYFETLECENKKQWWTEQMIAFGASEYG